MYYYLSKHLVLVVIDVSVTLAHREDLVYLFNSFNCLYRQNFN